MPWHDAIEAQDFASLWKKTKTDDIGCGGTFLVSMNVVTNRGWLS